MEMTCDNTSTPSVSRRKLRATVAAATLAAVSRADARSRMGRASSMSYLSIPAKSACPGRGLVSFAPRPEFMAAAMSESLVSMGSADMMVVHLGHSVLPIMMAMGPPSVCPCRTPVSMVTSSASNFMRAPLPYPRRRRASCVEMSSLVMGTPAGMCSSSAIKA